MAGKSQRQAHEVAVIPRPQSRAERKGTPACSSHDFVQYYVVQGPAYEAMLPTLDRAFLHQLTTKKVSLKHATGQPVLYSPSTEVLLSEDLKLRDVNI